MQSNGATTSEFLTEAAGPKRDCSGVFEDDGETGYLFYCYEPEGREVFQHVHIYDRTPNVAMQEQDVRIVWSDDFSKVGVQIWGKMRGIIDLATGQEGRIWLENRNTPGIDDAEWLKGFRL